MVFLLNLLNYNDMALVITLIVVGVLLIIAELVLIPGVFVAGTLGLASLVGSCYFAFSEWGQMGGVIVIGVNVVLLVVFVVLALRSKTWRRFTLDTNIDSHTDATPVDKGVSMGQRGVTVTRLCPMGRVKIGDLFLEVTSQDGVVNAGVEVEVCLIDDNKVYVTSNIN